MNKIRFFRFILINLVFFAFMIFSCNKIRLSFPPRCLTFVIVYDLFTYVGFIPSKNGMTFSK